MFSYTYAFMTVFLLTLSFAQDSRPEGWSEVSHGKTTPNYETVFSQDEIKTLTLSISEEAYAAMLENMTELYGEPSGEEGGRGPGGFGGPPPESFEGGPPPNSFADGAPPAAPDGVARGFPGGRPDGAEGPLAIGGVTENPAWVEATVSFEDEVWTHVGLRFKGNSTLSRSWNSGSQKLPLKLDFDEFEDAYPEIDNQRFYGFKQLSLGNNIGDDSFLRDAASYSVLRDAGLIAPATTWYEVYLEVGEEEPVRLGLYTVIEVVDDTVIETALGDDSGNIYEGDGSAATLAAGTLAQLEDGFQKENNENSGYEDVEALYAALHADTRLGDAAQWRTNLETTFDVATFLRWLAVNSVIQNWDTYGAMAHNYYLYALPEKGQLSWIGWDYNEALRAGRRGRQADSGDAGLSQESVTDAWPLIRYLLDDPVYAEVYAGYVKETSEGAFEPDKMAAAYEEWAVRLEPYAAQEVTAEAFEAAMSELTQQAYAREAAVSTFLDETVGASQ